MGFETFFSFRIIITLKIDGRAKKCTFRQQIKYVSNRGFHLTYICHDKKWHLFSIAEMTQVLSTRQQKHSNISFCCFQIKMHNARLAKSGKVTWNVINLDFYDSKLFISTWTILKLPKTNTKKIESRLNQQ